jgi:hypothetical protein
MEDVGRFVREHRDLRRGWLLEATAAEFGLGPAEAEGAPRAVASDAEDAPALDGAARLHVAVPG